MDKKTILLSDNFRTACPGFCGCAVYAPIKNSEYSAQLWEEIGDMTKWLREEFTTDTVKQRSGILATRQGYKACGKDPSRYRPSNEQLCRRLLQGKDLYTVSTIVDLINLVSIKYAYSIGGFDYDKIEGQTVILGIGEEGEPYEGIGRGVLNIAGMPVYRDSIGGIGTPTSDNERTKLSLHSTHLVCFINGYDGNKDNVRACGEMIRDLLVKYASTNIEDVDIDFFAQ